MLSSKEALAQSTSTITCMCKASSALCRCASNADARHTPCSTSSSVSRPVTSCCRPGAELLLALEISQRSAGVPELELGVAEFGAAGVRSASGRSSPRGSEFMTLRDPSSREKMLPWPCVLPCACPLRRLPSPPPPPPPAGALDEGVAGAGGTLPVCAKSASPGWRERLGDSEGSRMLDAGVTTKGGGNVCPLLDWVRRGELSAASSNSSSCTAVFKCLELMTLLVRFSMPVCV